MKLRRSFLMITLALSQVLWGTAYRWAAVTEGDKGLSGLTRPAPYCHYLGGNTCASHFCQCGTAT